MQDNTMMAINNQKTTGTYAGISDIQVRDDAFYRNVRNRFLQQSAQYLGADLNDSKTLSLCFEGVTRKDLFTN